MLQDLVVYLTGLAREQFYGTVELKYEEGRIVLVKVNRTLKPEDFRRG